MTASSSSSPSAQIQLARALAEPPSALAAQWSLIEAAMAQGANFDGPLEPGRLEHSPSHVAADSCSGALLRRLWAAFGPWNLANKEPADGMTPLLCAAESGNAQALGFLISQGADPAERSSSGASAATLAAGNAGAACLDALLLAHPNALLDQDASGRGLMAICIQANNGAGLARLIQAGAQPEALINKRRPLALACEAGAERCVRALLDLGASPNRADFETRGPLALALSLPHPGCAIALVEAGAAASAPASAARDTRYTDAAFIKTLSGPCKAYWAGMTSSLAEQSSLDGAEPGAIARARARVLARGHKRSVKSPKNPPR